MHTSKLNKQVMDKPGNVLLIRVDSGDQLWDHLEPDFHRGVLYSFIEHIVDLIVITVVEPDCQ